MFQPNGISLHVEAVNVASEDALKDFFERVGAFDHLVFTAGEDLPLGPIADKNLNDARERFEIRFWGALASAKHGVRSIRQGGSITLTSGFSSGRPRSGWTMQASIQSAVEGLTRALAVELAPIRVNAVSPGLARTPRWNSWTESEREAFYRNEEKRLPVGRVGEAAEIATAYLYLMENSYVTGRSSPLMAAVLSFKDGRRPKSRGAIHVTGLTQLQVLAGRK